MKRLWVPTGTRDGETTLRTFTLTVSDCSRVNQVPGVYRSGLLSSSSEEGMREKGKQGKGVQGLQFFDLTDPRVQSSPSTSLPKMKLFMTLSLEKVPLFQFFFSSLSQGNKSQGCYGFSYIRKSKTKQKTKQNQQQ